VPVRGAIPDAVAVARNRLDTDSDRRRLAGPPIRPYTAFMLQRIAFCFYFFGFSCHRRDESGARSQT
jgi:hypothetical protein